MVLDESLETKWDLFSLLGKPEPMGLSLDLVLDGYTDRGVGVGFDIGYSANRTNADLDLYFLSDAGEQKTTSGIKMSGTSTTNVALPSYQARQN